MREKLLPVHDVLIVEMGARRPGDIAEICELVRPKYGIITAIGEQHLETFKTVENIIGTKFELADYIPDDGLIFLNGDDKYIKNKKTGKPFVTYSVRAGSGCDYTAFDISVSREGSRFTVAAPDGERCVFTTKLLGAHNIQNITGCIAVAHRLGIPLSELVVSVRRLKPVEHRLQLLPNGYIDDSYNSNPAGFRAALDVLSQFSGRGFGNPGMVELGERRYQLNRAWRLRRFPLRLRGAGRGKSRRPRCVKGCWRRVFKRSGCLYPDLNKAIEIVNSLPNEGSARCFWKTTSRQLRL